MPTLFLSADREYRIDIFTFHVKFQFTTKDDTKAVRALRFINTREAGAMTPFIKLAAESILY
jgi:hypothetical protein